MVDPDAPTPERRTYGLKRPDPGAVEPPNTPPPQVLTTTELAKLAGVHHAPREHAAGGASAKADDPNDVVSIRHELRDREKAEGQDRMEIRKRKSRRKRDYLLVMTVLNVGFGAVLAYGILHRNPVLMIYAFSGMVLSSVGVTWVMWFIMSDY